MSAERPRKGRWALEFQGVVVDLQDLEPPSQSGKTTIPSRHCAARLYPTPTPTPNLSVGAAWPKLLQLQQGVRTKALGIVQSVAQKDTQRHRGSGVHTP
jgi:hypothetical protein